MKADFSVLSFFITHKQYVNLYVPAKTYDSITV